MRIGWLSYKGTPTTSFGSHTTGMNVHNAAERDVTTYQIAGRNGDLVVDNGRYKNIEITYPCFTMNLSANEQGIRNHFGYDDGSYGILTDSYDTTHFRKARHIGEIEFEPVRPNAANYELTFDCDPRRFLNSGTSSISVSGSATLTNPTSFDAKPLITVSGITEGAEIEFLGDTTYTLVATDDYADALVIDCETQNIYDSVTMENKNSLFTVSDFPVLSPGSNTITITGTVTSCSIVPRWWEL